MKDASNDKGKDVVVERDGVRYVVECKHQDAVGRPVIQKLQGAMSDESRSYDEVKGMVVTTGTFSNPPEEYAESTEIELVDGEDITKLCDDAGIDVVNGRIQVSDIQCLQAPSEGLVDDAVHNKLDTVNGFDSTVELDIESSVTYKPSAVYTYDVSDDFVGAGRVIRRLRENGVVVIDGLTRSRREDLEPLLTEHGEPFEKESYEDVTVFEAAEEELDSTARESSSNANTQKPSHTLVTTTSHTRRPASQIRTASTSPSASICTTRRYKAL